MTIIIFVPEAKSVDKYTNHLSITEVLLPEETTKQEVIKNECSNL
jgi:hypothetical protein